ncbi:transposase family protein [Streptomyces nodosus]|uniref:helix-turn-helix domain-containing protein n=1 Tax=Streptomyces nodosus TaxID=40318 RepID=UPI0036E60C60
MEEEVQRVFDALDGLAEIEDPKARALAVAKILKGWSKQGGKLRELRRQAVLELLAPKEASVRSVAKELGVSPTTIQDIKAGYAGSGKERPESENPRPRKKPATE